MKTDLILMGMFFVGMAGLLDRNESPLRYAVVLLSYTAGLMMLQYGIGDFEGFAPGIRHRGG